MNQSINSALFSAICVSASLSNPLRLHIEKMSKSMKFLTMSSLQPCPQVD